MVHLFSSPPPSYGGGREGESLTGDLWKAKIMIWNWPKARLQPSPSLPPRMTGRAIACGPFRRLDRSAKRGAERPCVNDKQLIGDRRSLRAALRALVETTEIFASTTCDSPRKTGEAYQSSRCRR